MKTLVILPMGAHPFHAGHMALYNSAKAAFPDSDVYIAATNDTSTRPFPFAVKQKLAKLSGVPENRFIPVKSPFRADEITKSYNPADTQLIFVRSEKDATKPPQPGGVKRDGNPAYLQPISDQMSPMTQHAYMAYLPTVEFGPGMTSATQIRTAWPELNERQRTALVMSLYPATQKNPKLAKNVVQMLDTAMGAELTEVLDTKASKSNSQWNTSDPDMTKFNFTASNGVQYQLDFLEPYIGPDEMNPYDFFDSDDVYNKSKFVSFEQLTNDTKGGYPVTKQGIEGTGSAAEVFGIVINAIIQYVKKARPALLYFQAAEPNRRALYARMIQRILPALPGWSSTANDAGQFAIYNKRAIKSAMGGEAQGVAEGSQEINWVKPNFDFEWHEVEEQSRMKQVPDDVRQYYQKHFPNKDAWLKAVQNGKAVVVPPDHTYEIRNAPFDKASLQKVLAPTGHEGPIGPAKEKRVNDLFDKGQVEMPIIIKTSQGLWLIGGKTRLGTANYVKGLPAKVWLISGEQGVAEGSDHTAEAYRAHLIKTLPQIMKLFANVGKGWIPSREQMLSAVDNAYQVMKHTGDVKQAGKALMDELNTLYRMNQGRKGVDEEVTRQMSQGGMRASYQSKYNQPIAEDYLDEARS